MPRYILVHETASTNSYASRMAAMLPSGTVIHTPRQTAGRGQRGNSWEMEPDKNLALSYLLKNPAVVPAEQFYISEAASLAIVDALSVVLPGVSIKWPNDIYYGDRKLAGILIEHSLTSRQISQTIIGIGLNVNQQRFVSDAPNPVSLWQITGEEYNLTELLHGICNRIEQYTAFERYGEADFANLHSRYMSHLYRNDGAMHRFALPNGEQFDATIDDVRRDGILTLRHADGKICEYAFKEVAFVI